MPEPYALILITCASSDEAKQIARQVVADRLAAGVQILPISSVYTWQREIVEDEEHLLICKTRSALYEKIEETVQDLHSYQVPPILMLEIDRASDAYLEWIRANTGR